MRHVVKLPWELIEEILSRVPPKSLVRFRTVSKQWNALFDDKTFINNHKLTFRFILTTKSKIYSVSIDPKIVVRELTLYIPGLESQVPKKLFGCDEFLLCGMDNGGSVVWNPWLNQTRWIKPEDSQPRLELDGIGYDSNRYKTIWYKWDELDPAAWKIHDFASGAWKDIKSRGGGLNKEIKYRTLHSKSGVSLNGNLYWVAYYDKTDPLTYHITYFDFSREGFFKFSDIPVGMNHRRDALVLRVFKRDQFSLLKQCYETKKIEVWVTKNKINVEDRDDIIWMNYMTVLIPNFPGLVQTISCSQPSYYIDDKRLVVCSCDETGQVWIYVVGEKELISKVQIDHVADPRSLHCTYFPSLVPVPQGQREEAELQL